MVHDDDDDKATNEDRRKIGKTGNSSIPHENKFRTGQYRPYGAPGCRSLRPIEQGVLLFFLSVKQLGRIAPSHMVAPHSGPFARSAPSLIILTYKPSILVVLGSDRRYRPLHNE